MQAKNYVNEVKCVRGKVCIFKKQTYLLINLMDLFSTRTSDRDQIWNACADRDETGSHLKKNVPPHPRRV